MTEQILQPQPFAEVSSNFSAGHVFSQTFAILSRNFLPFCLVTLVASLPTALVSVARMGMTTANTTGGGAKVAVSGSASLMILLGGLGMMVLGTISQAAILYGAFDDMRGRSVDLVESLKVGLRRFFPVLVVAIAVVVLASLAGPLLVFPAFIVMTMLFVSIPACVVERLGPIKSMGRSAGLTKGHRWKIFGLFFATLIVGLILQSMLGGLARSAGGPMVGIVALLFWNAVWNAFQAILAVVTYHDLRVAKEGVNTDQIAAVFD